MIVSSFSVNMERQMNVMKLDTHVNIHKMMFIVSVKPKQIIKENIYN